MAAEQRSAQVSRMYPGAALSTSCCQRMSLTTARDHHQTAGQKEGRFPEFPSRFKFLQRKQNHFSP